MNNLKIVVLLFMSVLANAQVIPIGFIKSSSTFVSQSTGTNPVTADLLFYLDATRTASYSGSGTTWTDISGSGRSATLSSGTVFGSGSIAKGSGSFTFNNGHAQVGGNSISLSTPAATFIAWVNPSQRQNEYMGIIFSRPNYGGSNANFGATGMNLRPDNQVGYHWNDGASSGWISGLTVPNTQWSMIVITVTSTTVTAYLCNASGITTANSSSYTNISLSDLKFFIGSDPGALPARVFKGNIGTAMVYSSALSRANIESIFNAQKAAFGIAPLAVGDSFGGGKIFYILKSGDAGYDANIQHGLIAATSDLSAGDAPWSINKIFIGNTSLLIGSGLANTTRIISLQGNTGNYAAKIARDYVSNGFSDWYLPSHNEMKELIAQRAIVGGFSVNSYYWTSSECTTNLGQTDLSTYANTAWIQQNASTIPVPNEAGKDYNSTAVRPIRSF